MHSHWQDLAWDCYTSFFANLYHSYGPWFTLKFRFRSIYWELLDIFSPNLYMHSYWQDLAWDCYTSFFGNLYQSYGPLFTPKIRFRSISWEPIGRIACIYIDKIYVGIVTRHFSHIRTRVMDLDLRPNLFPLNIWRTNGQRNSGLLLHAKHCSGAIVIFSDNSSYT